MTNTLAWSRYLDRLDASLRTLYEGATACAFPGTEDLGPLPDELRERAESLLRSLRLAEEQVRARRAAVEARLRSRRRRRPAAYETRA